MTAPLNSAAGLVTGKVIPQGGGVPSDISVRDCQPGSACHHPRPSTPVERTDLQKQAQSSPHAHSKDRLVPRVSSVLPLLVFQMKTLGSKETPLPQVLSCLGSWVRSQLHAR